MRKKIVVIIGLIIGLSILALSTIQPISEINEDVIVVNNENLEIFYFNNLDPENPYNQDFNILSDKKIINYKKPNGEKTYNLNRTKGCDNAIARDKLKRREALREELRNQISEYQKMYENQYEFPENRSQSISDLRRYLSLIKIKLEKQIMNHQY